MQPKLFFPIFDCFAFFLHQLSSSWTAACTASAQPHTHFLIYIQWYLAMCKPLVLFAWILRYLISEATSYQKIQIKNCWQGVLWIIQSNRDDFQDFFLFFLSTTKNLKLKSPFIQNNGGNGRHRKDRRLKCRTNKLQSMMSPTVPLKGPGGNYLCFLVTFCVSS